MMDDVRDALCKGDWLRPSRCLSPFLKVIPAKSGIQVVQLFVVCILAVAGCSASKPVLYPNDHYKAVGEEQAQRDMEDCQEQAAKAGATPGSGKAAQVAKGTAISGGIGAAAGAVGGAIVGSAGTGAAIGAASGAVWGLLGSLFRSNEPGAAHKGYVLRCLKDKGYDPTGWD
jgi:hypothetical protein